MEQVLVVKTEKLDKFLQNRVGLITDSRRELLELIINEHEFMARPLAEEDPGYRQIIPYVVLCRGEEVFATRRLNKGGEARLHGKISVGIGGHINPVDETDREKVLMRGLERELHEEVTIQKAGKLVPRGVINDNTNSVGSVHLGLCFTMEVEGEVSVNETEKLTGAFMTLPELRAEWDNMETWTQIALEGIFG